MNKINVGDSIFYYPKGVGVEEDVEAGRVMGCRSSDGAFNVRLLPKKTSNLPYAKLEPAKEIWVTEDKLEVLVGVFDHFWILKDAKGVTPYSTLIELKKNLTLKNFKDAEIYEVKKIGVPSIEIHNPREEFERMLGGFKGLV